MEKDKGDVKIDENVEEMKKLLEKGYTISSRQINFQKQDGEKVVTDTVILKKEGDEKTITSTNSAEFFEYINHFKKIIDKYDNNEFVYIGNLKQYNKNIKKHPSSPVLKGQNKLKISGYEFDKEVMTIYLRPSGPGNSRGLAEFWLDLEKNPNFLNVDLKDELEVYNKSNQLVFKGFINNYESSDTTGFIFAQDMSIKMEHERVSAEFNNMHPTDCVGLLTESAGFNFCPSSPYNISERNFVIIIPVQNLIMNASFAIGDVEFYQKFDTLDDSLIRESKTGRENQLWNGNFPRAKIIVQAKQFYEAITKGYHKIARAIDVIALRVDFSFPSIKIKQSKIDFNFSYYKNLAKVKIPTWIYCREQLTKSHCFYNIETLRENILNLDIDPGNYFNNLDALCGDLISKEDPTQEEKNLIQTLHWLRRSIQEGNKKDKLIDLWTSFEFLISGINIDNLFTEQDKIELKNIISKTYLDTFQKNAMEGKIDMLNDPPLLSKFRKLIEDLDVIFSQDELNILKVTRNKRNDLIHGRRDIEVKDLELTKMRTIIEKILLAKINRLS